MRQLLVGASLLFGLGACSSLTEGTSQTLTFESDPPGAVCELKRAGIIIGRATTPGTVLVQKTRADIEVTCRKPGYEDAVAQIPYDMAVSTIGNVLIGGGIGLIVDAASGASIKYNPVTSVTLVAKSGADAPAAVASVAPATQPATQPAMAGQVAAAPADEAKPKLDRDALWRISEPALKKHFENNREAYGAVFAARSAQEIKLNRLTLMQDQPEEGGLYSIVVRFEGEAPRTGFYAVGFMKDFNYKIRQEQETVSVLDWQVRSN